MIASKEGYMKEYSWVQAPTFFLYFDVTPKKGNCNGTSKTERQQKLLARWLATVLRIQLTGCNDNVV